MSEYCYLGRKRCCGRVAAICKDDDLSGESLSEFIDAGCYVERHLQQEALKLFHISKGCEKCENKIEDL